MTSSDIRSNTIERDLAAIYLLMMEDHVLTSRGRREPPRSISPLFIGTTTLACVCMYVGVLGAYIIIRSNRHTTIRLSLANDHTLSALAKSAAFLCPLTNGYAPMINCSITGVMTTSADNPKRSNSSMLYLCT